MKDAASPPDPALVLDLIEAFRRSKTMFAAVSLGVFEALAAGPRTASDLASELGTDAGALRRLLDACVGLRLLERDGARYRNSASAAAYLTQSSANRLTGYIRYSNDVLWKLWGALEDAVREGTHRWTQVYGWEGPLFSHFFHTEAAKREFLMGMHGFGLISSPHVVRAFDLTRFRRLADLGGATGHLAIAACECYPQLAAVVFDLPDAVDLAGEIVAASPVAGRIEVMAGNFFADPLPQGDLFALGRILHDWPEEKIVALLGRIYTALPQGGALLVAEKLLLDDATGPSWAQMQDLNMLTCAEGRERTLAEYEALLRQAGFGEVSGCRTSAPLDAILAVKLGA
ncbi:MAG TPA: class I SAM-dependent methyltransferase [Vicinamibacterales bacterium]|nr:class I SAM-dependent methyltransferase [Vicinamibacterales bacterium]